MNDTAQPAQDFPLVVWTLKQWRQKDCNGKSTVKFHSSFDCLVACLSEKQANRVLLHRKKYVVRMRLLDAIDYGIPLCPRCFNKTLAELAEEYNRITTGPKIENLLKKRR